MWKNNTRPSTIAAQYCWFCRKLWFQPNHHQEFKESNSTRDRRLFSTERWSIRLLPTYLPDLWPARMLAVEAEQVLALDRRLWCQM